MKILYVITKSEIGGAQTHVSQLVDHFSRGNEVFVMSFPGGWLEKEVEGKAQFIPNKYFSNSFNLVSAWKAGREIVKAVASIQPDIVHCHSSGAATFTRLAVPYSTPVVYTAHGWGFNTGTPWLQKTFAIMVEKLLSPNTKKIICVSDFVKNLAMKYQIAPEDKFTVIHNGIKIEQIPAKVGKDKLQIVTVGRLAEPKVPELLVDAVSKCDEATKNRIKLLIIGDGPKRLDLENKIKQSGVTAEIKTLTPVETRKALEQSDIFALLSRWEGFPYSVIEAMAAGLPVIASDVGGINEAVKGNGYLINNNDQAEIVRAITELVTKEDLRTQMGRKSRKTAEQEFNEALMLKQIEGVYLDVMKK